MTNESPDRGVIIPPPVEVQADLCVVFSAGEFEAVAGAAVCRVGAVAAGIGDIVEDSTARVGELADRADVICQVPRGGISIRVDPGKELIHCISVEIAIGQSIGTVRDTVAATGTTENTTVHTKVVAGSL